VAPGSDRRLDTPDPELIERPKRRRFTAEYKLRILQAADACSRPGEIGALLRREGLYTSHLSRGGAERVRRVMEYNRGTLKRLMCAARSD